MQGRAVQKGEAATASRETAGWIKQDQFVYFQADRHPLGAGDERHLRVGRPQTDKQGGSAQHCPDLRKEQVLAHLDR